MPYHLSKKVARAALDDGLLLTEVMDTAEHPDLVYNLKGTLRNHLKGEVRVVVDPPRGVIVSAHRREGEV